LDVEGETKEQTVKRCMLAWSLLRFVSCSAQAASFKPTSYLRRIVARAIQLPLAAQEKKIIAAISVLLHGCQPSQNDAKRVRRDLLKLGWEFELGAPDLEVVKCFDPNVSDGIWGQVLKVQAPFETMAAIEAACNSGLELPDIDFLTGYAKAEMTEIKRVFDTKRWKSQFLFAKAIPRGCPKCAMTFSVAERAKLEAFSCTIHSGLRCGRLLMITGVS
jgi:hypothetical protein